jgi:carboxyl-terminal processing protease
VKITIAKYYIPSGRCVQALDYTHRKDDGSVAKVADSLMHEFKTKDGRSVYDGGGVYPDIPVKQEGFANITKTLVSKLYIFDYATIYRNKHKSIGDDRTFHLTDAEYGDFVKYLADKNYNYTTGTEKLLNTLKTEATKEKEFANIQTEYDALKEKLLNNKKNDLQQNKAEIEQVLENEISSRYYYERGRYETNFKYDKELAEAIKIMEDKNQIAAILKGDGEYKVIGKPQLAMMPKKVEDKESSDDQ